MKRLDEYTNEELCALDDEAIVNLVNVECANEGAPLMSVQAPSPPSKPDAEPDVMCYTVEVRDLRYATAEEAQTVANFLNNTRRLTTESIGKSSWGPPYQLVPHDSEPTVKTERHWTAAYYHANQKELEAYDEAKGKFETEQREFRKLREARDTVCRNVTARIDEARDDLRLRERIRTQFEEYCALASGDRELALTFLLKTGRFNEDIVRTTLNMELPKEKEHGDAEED